MKTWALHRKAHTSSEPECVLAGESWGKETDASELGLCRSRGKEEEIPQWVTLLKSDLGEMS